MERENKPKQERKMKYTPTLILRPIPKQFQRSFILYG